MPTRNSWIIARCNYSRLLSCCVPVTCKTQFERVEKLMLAMARCICYKWRLTDLRKFVHFEWGVPTGERWRCSRGNYSTCWATNSKSRTDQTPWIYFSQPFEAAPSSVSALHIFKGLPRNAVEISIYRSIASAFGLFKNLCTTSVRSFVWQHFSDQPTSAKWPSCRWR